VEDGDFAGDLADEDHVVFDDDDAVFAGEAEEEFAGAGGFLVGHAGGGFVDEEELRVLGEEHADLEPLLLAVGEGRPSSRALSARPTVLSTSWMRSRCGGVMREKSVLQTPRGPSRESQMFSKTVCSM
jgi:hypothetical protein